MSENFTKLSERFKSALPHSWMLVAVAITYVTYMMFSITNRFVQIVVGVLISVVVIVSYVVAMARFGE